MKKVKIILVITDFITKLPKIMNPRLIPNLLAASLLFAGAAQARTIVWGTDVDSLLIDSSGALLDSSYTFELGSFGSFIPTSTNMDEWLTNWKVFDRATAPGVNGYNPDAGYVASSAVLEADQTTDNLSLPQDVTFEQGEQAYIFAYQGLDLNSVIEWALVTNDSSDGDSADDWIFPISDTRSPDTLDWKINGASAAVFGGENGTQGPGDYTGTQTGFVLQTATAVPEPGSALFILLSGLLMNFRRKRS